MLAPMQIATTLYQITLQGAAEALWSYRVRASGRTHHIAAPVFEVDGVLRPAALTSLASAHPPVQLPHGPIEYTYSGVFADVPSLRMDIVLRCSDASPIVRVRYVLRSTRPHYLTKSSGRDMLSYLAISFADLPQVTEVRLSEFIELVHSFCLSEIPVMSRQFEDGLQVMGPLLVGSDGQHAALVAYEHGSQIPDAFVQFHLCADRRVTMQAVKGAYLRGERLDERHPYHTLWLQVAAIAGDEALLAKDYRSFVLHDLSPNMESRKPYIFYNTWNYQERNKWWNGRPYLESMQRERILQEIDVAHRMGIEVFVLDTGWYERTGDWRINTTRFPDELREVKRVLDRYDMKLGLWFGPTSTAVSSSGARTHRGCAMSWRGQEYQPVPVWETEESYHMCLVSPYGDVFADELIRLAREVGVTYFKWDAIGQYGCDSPAHGHGDERHTPEERADCYAFRLGPAMTHIVNRLCETCPEAIVDFDITEGRRAVGLDFLSAGKYFLINNGPYYRSYDVPSDLATQNPNIFFYPGPARGWVCRTPLSFDKWIPSVLFLTHYLPDDPADAQLISIASLILGQNGIWGDLLRVSDEGVRIFSSLLARYKEVRDDITASAPVRVGMVGGSPEVHEKISPRTRRGVVAVFASSAGAYSYVTEAPVTLPYWHADGVSVSLDHEGRARIDLVFEKAGAHLIFFGVG